MPKVFDCFTFFNELDLLEFRFKYLYDVVDHFVICEAATTFQNNPKQKIFARNSQRFSEFASKVIYLPLELLPGETPWEREHFQRLHLRSGLSDKANPDDLIIISDVDEIPNKEAIGSLPGRDGIFRLEQSMYCYHMNYRVGQIWDKAFAYPYRHDRVIGDFNVIRRDSKVDKLEQLEFERLQNAGWHFTYMGGAETMVNKLSAYSHQGPWADRMLQTGIAEAHVLAGFLVWSDEAFGVLKDVDKEFPADLASLMSSGPVSRNIKTRDQRISDLQRSLIVYKKALDAKVTVEKEIRDLLDGQKLKT